MFKNYFKIAWRNLIKNKAFSLINISGLAVSMSVCLFIINLITERNSIDQFHKNKNRIFRVLTFVKNNNDERTATAAFPLAAKLKAEFPGIEKTSAITRGIGGDIFYGDKIATGGGYYADNDLLNILDFKLSNGNKETVFQNPYSIVLTEDMATLLFGQENPIGKVVKFNDKHINPGGTEVGNREVELGDFSVTGVMQKPAGKTNLPFTFLISQSTMPALTKLNILNFQENDWNNVWANYIYVLVEKGKTKSDLQIALNQIAARQYPKGSRIQYEFKAQGITEIALGNPVGNESSVFFPKTIIFILSVLGLIVMLSACLNYTNLSVARSLSRAKEVGLRKVVGASRRQIFTQFIAEAILVSILSLVVATGLFELLKLAYAGLWINSLFRLSFENNLLLYLIFLGFSVFIGLIAGFLPSFYISIFSPIQMMKNFAGIKLFQHVTLRKVLLVTQFCVSLIFIISTVLLQKQTNHLMNFDFGFNENNIINIKLYKTENYLRFADEIAKNKHIIGISAAEFAPATGSNNSTMLYKADNKKDSLPVQYIDIDSKCLNVWGIKLLQGKNLPELASDSTDRYVLVNEEMVKKFKFTSNADAIGQKVILDGNSIEITGVVKNFQSLDLTNVIQPLLLRNRSSRFGITSVKISSQNIPETIAFLEKSWKNVNPKTKFEYQFFDEQLKFTYSIFNDISKILSLLSFLAVFISCLGLLGMATYTAETRTKEVGIRKVLGSSVWEIIVLLSRSYFVLLLVGILIATPISYFLNNFWLEFFPYRVKFGIEILIGSALLLMMISLLIVLTQSYRASTINPIKNLRTE